MLDSAKLKDMIQDGGGGRAGAIHAISRVLTSTLKSLHEASWYEWVEEEEGLRRIPLVGAWQSFDDFKASSYWDDWCWREDYSYSDLNEDDLKKLEALWDAKHRKREKDEKDRSFRRECALAACDAAAKEHGIPFDRDLALSTAQCQADAAPDWITSNC